jgi:hypothetical protein
MDHQAVEGSDHRPHRLGPGSSPPHVRLLSQVAETRHAGAVGGEPTTRAEEASEVPSGSTFDPWLGITSPDGLHIRADHQVTFGVTLKAIKVGNTEWTGHRDYHDGTSTVSRPR